MSWREQRWQQTGNKIKGLPAGGAADDKDHVAESEIKKSLKVRVCLFVRCLFVCLFVSNQTRAATAAVAKTAASYNIPLIWPATANDIFKPIFMAEYQITKKEKNNTRALCLPARPSVNTEGPWPISCRRATERVQSHNNSCGR